MSSTAMKLTWEECRKIAVARMKLHANHASNRPLSKDYEILGMAGEFAFHKLTGLPMDLSLRPSGDNGIDFHSQAGTIDVKTARKPWHLIHEEGKAFADIYVLARYYDETESAALLKWEYGPTLKAAPTDEKRFRHGVTNHYIHHSRLRPMNTLLELLGLTTFFPKPAPRRPKQMSLW